MTLLDSRPVQPATRPIDWLAARSEGIMPFGSILLHSPSFAFQAPGGGENQLIQTGKSLESLGIPVRLFSPWTDRLERARLLHLFGMSHEGLELARIARRRGIPVVLSPICWYQPQAIWTLEPSLRRKVGGLARWGIRSIAPRLRGWRRELLGLSNAILPNSRAEANQLIRLFALDPDKVHIVPNGISAHFALADPAPFRSVYGSRPFVLSVGRIEPRKNTLELVRATRKLDLPLVVIGNPVDAFTNYAQQCHREGGTGITWIGNRDYLDPLLASAYAAARVFALPSWFETPGLAALEAALAGCPVVITPYGSTREYFGNSATYARPHRLGEITGAIQDCWRLGKNSRLSEFMASRYLWPVVAQRTAEIYDQVTG